jgi:hypothetical protein
MPSSGSEQFAPCNSVGPTCALCSSSSQGRRISDGNRNSDCTSQARVTQLRLLPARSSARAGPNFWAVTGTHCCPSTAKGLRKSQNYFFLDSFFDSSFESLGSFVARLDSPGRYSSCSAAAKAFSNPTISSPGRSVSNDSTSLRSCSSE